MKITKIETFKFWANYCNWLFARVSTNEGIYGWGEGSLHGSIQAVETAIHEIGAYLIGKDPSGINKHWQAMYQAWRWRGGPVLSTALACLDIALWDIEGKRLGVPVYRLLGGPFRTSLRAYASHWMSGVNTPQQAYEQAREATRRGFSAFKWKIIVPNALRANENAAISHMVDLFAAAREGADSETDIFIECAEMLSPRTVIKVFQALAPFDPGWFEEPIPFENTKCLIDVQRQLPIPIACGERLLSRWEFLDLLTNNACKIIQPDVMHAKGITEVQRIASLADIFYIPVAPHNPGGPICMLASMHLSASIPNFLILEQMEEERKLRDELCTNPVKYSNGFFELPNEPGLGTDLIIEKFTEKKFYPQPISGSSETLWF
ncbi:MAG: mandelate racemase/muconate lactonizing enzyme family protein [Anaerolineales bacterium]|nr:mandelate racemase/muconate lactonizing enzyme family protein [Anaerolineales bacterium]